MPTDERLAGEELIKGTPAPGWFFYSKNNYSPEQWQEWYAKSSKHGTPEFAAHSDYLAAARPRLHQRNKEFLAHLMSMPADAQGGQVSVQQVFSKMGPDGRQLLDKAFKRAILGLPPLPEAEDIQPIVDIYRQGFLDWMRETSLGGVAQPDVSVTQEQYDQFDPDQATNTLSPVGKEALDKRKDYTLFSAFQTKPDHRPLAMEKGSSLTAALGLPGDLVGRAFSGPTSAGRSDFDSGAVQQLLTGFLPSPYNSVKWTMGWHRQGQRVPSDQLREYTGPIDRLLGVPAWSAADPLYSGLGGEGVDTLFLGGDTPWGSFASYLSALLNSTMRDAYSDADISPADSLAYARESMKTGRHTPIVPEGVQGYGEDGRPKWAAAQSAIQEMQNTDRSLLSTYLPKVTRNINYLIHQLRYPGIEPQGKDPYGSRGSAGYLPTTYGAAAANILPNTFVDVASDPTVVAGAVLPEAREAARLLRSGRPARAAGRLAGGSGKAFIDEVPGEAAFSGVTIGAPMAGAWNYFAQPDPGIPLQTSGGKLVDAESKNYLPALKQYESEVERDFGEMRRIATMRKTGPLGSGVIGFRPDRLKPITGSLISP